MARILVVEDDPEIRRHLVDLLRRADHEPVPATNGLNAVRSYHEDPTDLVITAIFMPELDGLETIAALRRICPDVKVIAIGPGAELEGETYLRAARSFGAVATLSKPVCTTALLDSISTLLDPSIDAD